MQKERQKRGDDNTLVGKTFFKAQNNPNYHCRTKPFYINYVVCDKTDVVQNLGD